MGARTDRDGGHREAPAALLYSALMRGSIASRLQQLPHSSSSPTSCNGNRLCRFPQKPISRFRSRSIQRRAKNVKFMFPKLISPL